jgi:class 3 adenylate cyclase/tetratricopeptide (TPR) repeat protein
LDDDSVRSAPDAEAVLLRLLEAHGIAHCGSRFVEHGLTVDVLGTLTDADLRELGLSMGDRKRFASLLTKLTESFPDVRPKDEAERRQMTVVFADLVGSTALSTQLDPEDMRGVVRSFHREVAAAVETYGGYVAQHLGDGAVAYFGWPEARENDAERAVRASLAITARVADLAGSLSVSMASRIGVATGRAIVGDVLYNQESIERPVIGETPNLAARLQSIAPENGVVISATTRQMVGGMFELSDLGELQLKGFSRPVHAFRVIGESDDTARFSALRGHQLSAFSGRDGERELLLAAWQNARLGRGGCASIVGESGIGKSRLAHQVREAAAADGGTEQTYDCSAYSGASAFYPFIRHLERSAGISREDEALTRWTRLVALVESAGLTAGTALPVLAKLLQIPIPVGTPVPKLESIQEKEIVMTSIITRLRHQAALGPVLFVVEDCHWIDPSSAELVGRLVAEIATLPVLALFCYRPEFVPAWPRSADWPVIELGRLTADNCREIVESLAEPATISQAMMQQIIMRADGVPLFVEELAKTLIESALARPPGGDRPDDPVPATLHDSLLARLDRLGDAKHVAQVAACVGREFGRELLLSVAGLSEEALDRALARLVASSLVLDHGAQHGGHYAFRHALVQDAAYESLLRTTRVTYHRQIAVLLERELSESAPEVIAHHYARAGVTEKEIDYWLRSGQRAIRASAYLEAIQHLTNGMQALTRLSALDPLRELAMTIHLAVPLTLTRGWAAEDVGKAYRRAHVLVHLLGEPPEAFPTLVGVFTYYLVRGEFARAYDLALTNDRLAVTSGNRELIMEAAHDRGTSALYTGRFDEALPYLQKTVELYDPTSDAHHTLLYNKLPGPTATAHILMILGLRGDQIGARAAAERSLADAESGGHAFSRLWVLTGVCVLHVVFGEIENLARVSSRLIEESQTLGFPNWLAQGLVWAGSAKAADDSDAGIAMIRQGLAIWTMTGAELMKPFLMTRLVEALLDAGQLDEAEQVYLETAALMSVTGEVWSAADTHRLGAELARRRDGDDSAAADHRYTLAMDAATHTGATVYGLAIAADQARACLRAGRRAEAVRILEPGLNLFRGSELPVVRNARSVFQEATAS